MSQTSYSYNQAVGFAGMLADDTETKDTISAVNPVVAIPYGVLVVKGTADRDVKLPTTTGEVTSQGSALGVAMSSQSIESSTSGVAQYPIGSDVPVLHKGRIWVKVEEAVVPTDTPFVRFAAGTGTQLGAFRKSADTATAVALPKSRFLTSAAANGLAILEIDL